MKKCLTLAVSLFFVGCAVGPAPHFPEDLKNYYVTIVDGEPLPADFERRISNVQDMMFRDVAPIQCLHFEIVQRHPVKIKYISEVPMNRCHLVGGFVPEDTTHLFNWVDDIWDWAEKRKKCFK